MGVGSSGTALWVRELPRISGGSWSRKAAVSIGCWSTMLAGAPPVKVTLPSHRMPARI